MTSTLQSLSQVSTVVADTGDIDAIKAFAPEDATTNPSLLLKAADLAIYQPLVDKAIEQAKDRCNNKSDQVAYACDKLAVLIGKEISQVVPGKVSTEVDARLSFDTEGSIKKAQQLIDMYQEVGVDRERVLIKLAATWEGIKAAEALEKQGIKCNLTLIFSFIQACACAEAGVFLISPFVGRIYDWFLQAEGRSHIDIQNDPGVRSVKQIYTHFKAHGFDTVVMAASFRTKEQVIALAGCDRLTISPQLLEQLKDSSDKVQHVLSQARGGVENKLRTIDEKRFRWDLNQDQMATEKLSEGIRGFEKDLVKLEQKLALLLN